MKVRARQAVEVEIDQHEIKKIAESYLTERFGICNARDYYHKIKDGKLIVVEEHSAGSHSHETERVVRKATPRDAAVLLILEAMGES